jgi:hypothetical protein
MSYSSLIVYVFAILKSDLFLFTSFNVGWGSNLEPRLALPHTCLSYASCSARSPIGSPPSCFHTVRTESTRDNQNIYFLYLNNFTTIVTKGAEIKETKSGATDDIGLLNARNLVEQGHGFLIHGRISAKLHKVAQELGLPESATYCYDLSKLASVAEMTKYIQERQRKLDVIINNAGIVKAPHTITEDGWIYVSP